MERTVFYAALGVLFVGLTGCGGSTPAPAPAAQAAVAGPDQTVKQFLEAVRSGDDATAQSMLTKLAQQKTKEMDMVVAPPGSDTAQFEVGQVQQSSDGTARVQSTWSDLDHEGSRRTDQIEWILRPENGQWRIVGMATQIFPDQGPVVLNFENPQEILEKTRQAEQAVAQPSGQTRQATKPQDPFAGERK